MTLSQIKLYEDVFIDLADALRTLNGVAWRLHRCFIMLKKHGEANTASQLLKLRDRVNEIIEDVLSLAVEIKKKYNIRVDHELADVVNLMDELRKIREEKGEEE